MSSEQEIILAQEQSVIRRDDILKEIQGTLVLSNKRLVFVAATQEEEVDAKTLGLNRRLAEFRYADVDDLNSIPSNPSNLSVSLDSIDSAEGHTGITHYPSLKVKWREGQSERKTEFIESMRGGGRKRSLKDWARVIELLKAGKITINFPGGSAPRKDTLEGKILLIMGDMQEKGLLETEEQVESVFSLDLDPDEVKSACESLVSNGFLDRVSDKSGEEFYRKRSPLGEDDLSS